MVKILPPNKQKPKKIEKGLSYINPLRKPYVPIVLSQSIVMFAESKIQLREKKCNPKQLK